MTLSVNTMAAGTILPPFCTAEIKPYYLLTAGNVNTPLEMTTLRE